MSLCISTSSSPAREAADAAAAYRAIRAQRAVRKANRAVRQQELDAAWSWPTAVVLVVFGVAALAVVSTSSPSHVSLGWQVAAVVNLLLNLGVATHLIRKSS